MEIPSRSDLEVVERQLGRVPLADVAGIVARCARGAPRVVVAHPLVKEARRQTDEAGGGWALVRPFPTVFWLTCPRVTCAVSGLESEGMIGEIRQRLQKDASLREAVERANARYAESRAALLTAEDVRTLEGAPAGMLEAVTSSGVGGIADPRGVKCLHMHVADYLAGNPNPIGEMVVQRLTERGTALDCDVPDGECWAGR